VTGAALLPHAAVRTAGAVRDLSDSGLIVRLTQGRVWIGVLGALLAGIVALNVVILSLNTGAGQLDQRIDRLERENSGLRAELAQRLSSGRVEAAAARLGMAVPDPRDITYLQAGDGDAKRAANALGSADS
jgi:cell division protein FtsL